MLKKIILSLTVIVTFTVYVMSFQFGRRQFSNISAISSAKNTAFPNTNAAVNYKDGSYTGSVADAYYGNIQVKATIQNGKISDVQFLTYPQDRSTSININNQAMPVLKSEAIQSQSANVSIVSGATDTSYAFQQSLAAALSQAQ